MAKNCQEASVSSDTLQLLWQSSNQARCFYI